MSPNIHLTNLQIMVEVLFASHMLAYYLEHREHYALRMIVSLVISMFAAWAFPLPQDITKDIVPWGILMYGSFFAVASGTLGICYRLPFISVLCCGIAGYTIHQTASMLNELIESVTLMAGGVPSKWMIWLVSTIPVYLISFLLISKHIKKNRQIQIDNHLLAWLSVMALIADIIIGLVLMELTLHYDIRSYEIVVRVMNLMICIFILILQNELLSNRHLQTELEIVSHMLEEEKRQYEQSRTNVELINQKCHDLRHQIRTIRKQEGDVDRSVLKEIERAVDIYDTSTNTGCTALDVILSEKKLLCESRGIMLTCIADGSGLVDIPSADIYALFGNILDNAMEAVSHVRDADAQSISLSVRRKGIITVIHEENRYDGTITMKDGLPETIKEDKLYHGFGVRSIRMIAENNNGSLNISTKDGIFSMTVMLSPDVST